eukprot:GHVQ01030664.1.p1 GENE.GHVQ01030664.1~~GHVQ01030664.1.p1  ORF type:complete len:853 (+),score=206.80 GHVQ01030664.1:423-2981(+)
MMTHFSPVRLFLSTSLVLRCGVMTFVLCGLVFYVQSYHMSYPLDVMDCNLYVNQLVTYPLFYYCTSSLPPTFTQSNNSRLPLSSLKHKDKPTTSTSLTCSYHPCPVTPSSTPLSPLLSSTTALDPPYTHARIYTHLLKTAFPSASSLHSKCRPFLLGKTQLWDPWSLTAVRFDGVAGRHAGRRACCGGVGHHSVISALPTEQAISATATAAPDTAASTAVTTAQPHGASSTVSAAAPHTSYTPGGRSPHTASPRQVRKDGLEKPGLVGNKKRDQQAQLKQSQLLEILQSAYTLQETLRLYWMYRKSLSANLISHIFIQLGRLAKEQSFNYSKGMWYERNCSKRELLTDNRLTALLDDLEDEATAGRLSRATQLAWIPWAIARLKTWQGRGGKRAGTREEGADDGMAPLEFADRSVSGEGSVGVSERRGGEGWGDGGEGDEDGVVEGVWMRCDRLLKFVDCVMCQSFGEYRQKAREEKKMIRRGKHKQQKQQQQQQQHQLQHQQQQLQQQQQPQPQQQQPEQQQQNQQYHTQPQADPLTDFTLLPSTHLKTNPIPPPLSESQSLPQGTPHLPRPTQDPSSSSSSLPPIIASDCSDACLLHASLWMVRQLLLIPKGRRLMARVLETSPTRASAQILQLICSQSATVLLTMFKEMECYIDDVNELYDDITNRGMYVGNLWSRSSFEGSGCWGGAGGGYEVGCGRDVCNLERLGGAHKDLKWWGLLFIRLCDVIAVLAAEEGGEADTVRDVLLCAAMQFVASVNDRTFVELLRTKAGVVLIAFMLGKVCENRPLQECSDRERQCIGWLCELTVYALLRAFDDRNASRALLVLRAISNRITADENIRERLQDVLKFN